MKKVTQTISRKSDHIRINLEEDVRSSLTTGLEEYRFVHQAIPELDLEDVDLSQRLFNRNLAAPILISSMTGGTKEAAVINRTLAATAQEAGIAMGLGSQRAAIEHPDREDTFNVRDVAPDILLFANLGAVQLNYGYGLSECERAVEMIAADALILHFNALQEAIQSEGNTRFKGLLKKVELICRDLSVPVIAKEVGWGFSKQDVTKLVDAGIAAIDVAGAGGTSWSQVEMHRAENESNARVAASFLDWGITTSQAVLNVRHVSSEIPIIASGGLRSGVDIAKCIALGACLGGMAGPFLKSAAVSISATTQLIEEIRREIQVTMFAAGVGDLAGLSKLELIKGKPGD